MSQTRADTGNTIPPKGSIRTGQEFLQFFEADLRRLRTLAISSLQLHDEESFAHDLNYLRAISMLQHSLLEALETASEKCCKTAAAMYVAYHKSEESMVLARQLDRMAREQCPSTLEPPSGIIHRLTLDQWTVKKLNKSCGFHPDGIPKKLVSILAVADANNVLQQVLDLLSDANEPNSVQLPPSHPWINQPPSYLPVQIPDEWTHLIVKPTESPQYPNR